ncbi:hypothetical protein MTO96_008122 [Rhipicephalus appendiculatus]
MPYTPASDSILLLLQHPALTDVYEAKRKVGHPYNVQLSFNIVTGVPVNSEQEIVEPAVMYLFDTSFKAQADCLKKSGYPDTLLDAVAEITHRTRMYAGGTSDNGALESMSDVPALGSVSESQIFVAKSSGWIKLRGDGMMAYSLRRTGQEN